MHDQIQIRSRRRLAADRRSRTGGRTPAPKPSYRDPRKMPRLFLLPGDRNPALRGRELPAVAVSGG